MRGAVAVIRLSGLTLLSVALLGWFQPVSAGTTGYGEAKDNSINARVDVDPGQSGGRTADPNAPICTTSRVNPMMEGIYRIDDNGNIVALFDDEHPRDGGDWYRETCRRNTTIVVSQRMYWVPNVTTTDLAKQALDSALLPAPTILITSTPPAITFANMPMWLWIDPSAWKPVTATASADGLTVTVTAKPTQVVWDSGDPRAAGNERVKTCIHPGKPFNPNFSPTLQYSDCTYTYRHTSGKQPDLTFPLTATLQWHATWTATNGTSGNLGTVNRSSTIPVKVGEIQALNVRPDEGFQQ